MAILIKGNNYGIAVEGNLKIDHIDFAFGQGIKAVSGVVREVDDAEIVDNDATEKNPTEEHPPVSFEQLEFIEPQIVIEEIQKGVSKRRVVKISRESIYHTIYDLTKEWDPSDSQSVHKWRILYEFMKRHHLITTGVREKYSQFVKFVVLYCFPDSNSNYNNNLSKINIPPKIECWDMPLKKIYSEIRDAVTPHLTSSKTK